MTITRDRRSQYHGIEEEWVGTDVHYYSAVAVSGRYLEIIPAGDSDKRGRFEVLGWDANPLVWVGALVLGNASAEYADLATAMRAAEVLDGEVGRA